MKKQDKIEIIQKGIQEKALCRCYFTYDPNYYHYFPNAVNDKFILGQEENDFLLDGYCIRKISQLRKVEIKTNACIEICRQIGITDQVKMPEVDISSWQTIFESLNQMNRFIIIEDENNDQFAIGVIEKIMKSKLYFKPFDADGIWEEDAWEIPYSTITAVKWGTRYADAWQRYLRPK